LILVSEEVKGFNHGRHRGFTGETGEL
jgi:hypothetical protein